MLGVDHNTSDDKLESAVQNMIKFMKIDDVSSRDIEGCHRLPLRKNDVNKPLIVTFVNGKIAEEIMERKLRLKYIDLSVVTLPKESNIFVNINLSPSLKR